MTRANFWPNRAQELLLTAALGDGEKAIDAWRRWLTLVVGPDLDFGSQRLAPLVYANLTRLGVQEPTLDRFKGFYRQAWCLNQRLFRAAEPVLRACEDAGVPTMVVKGVPLTLQIYCDMGLRPMSDFDLAVRPEHAGRAVALLGRLGWKAEVAPEFIAPRQHASWTFRSPAGIELDLHFSLFHERLEWQATEPIWRRAQPLKISGASTLAPCATDQFLHTVAHGLRTDPIPPIRWVADAARLMRGGQPIEWDALLDRAQSLRLMFVMQQALAYLSTGFDGVPAEILESASRYAPSRLERLEFHFCRERTHVGLVNYLRGSAGGGERLRVRGLLRFAQERWQTRSFSETFARLAKWAIFASWR